MRRTATSRLASASGALIFGWGMAAGLWAEASYEVDLASDRSLASVEASLTMTSDVLGLFISSSPELENGSADLLQGLEVESATGERLATEPLGEGDWRVLGVEPGDAVRVRYQVRLEHDQHPWSAGVDEVAYRRDEGAFFTGHALFLVPIPLPENQPVEVGFVLPDGWRATTPWVRIGEDRFEVRDFRRLTRNAMLFGDHVEEEVQLGEFTLTLAIGRELADARDLFVETTEPLLPAFAASFGGPPNEQRYLAVINPSEDRTDGGAFLDSYSLLIAGPVDATSRAVWGHGVAHELLHFWNGLSLFPAEPATEEWFKEGGTDYLTIVSLSRAGLDSWDVTRTKLENMGRRYVLARFLMGSQDSLRAAGAEKHRNRFLVYGGGALFCLVLDHEIREASGGERGLEDMLRELYADFAVEGAPYRYEDLVSAASRVAGKDLSELFARYVDGAEFLDPSPAFEAAGLRLTTMMDELYLTPVAEPTAAQVERARAWFGSSSPL